MPDRMTSIEQLIVSIKKHTQPKARHLIALVGAPGSGKSTLAQRLVNAFNALGEPASLVPMDGFHLDNRLLQPRGLLSRKGAPETFDSVGFVTMVRRLAEGEDVVAPVFDRERDLAIAGAQAISADQQWIIVEGNYLLLDQPVWRELHDLWDFSVWADVDEAELERRLMERWLMYGLSPEEAKDRALSNDMVNARLIAEQSITADCYFSNQDQSQE